MSALMSDLVSGKVTANIGNATCNAAGKMIKMVELEYKYGTNPARRAGLLQIAYESDIPAASPSQVAEARHSQKKNRKVLPAA